MFTPYKPRFMSFRPLKVPVYIEDQQHNADWFLKHVEEIRENLKRFNSDAPDITVIIPAYNEEESILRTLSSLAKTRLFKAFTSRLRLFSK